MVSFTEAAIGLFLLALLITYLPRSTRPSRAGSRASPRSRCGPANRRRARDGAAVLAPRAHAPSSTRSGTSGSAGSSTSRRPTPRSRHSPSSASPQADHSWVTAAGAVLDGAALTISSIDVPHDVQADICIRAGYLSLRRIAEAFGIGYERRPSARRPDLDHAAGMGRRDRRPRGVGRADQGRSRPGVARLRRLARELRHGAARARPTSPTPRTRCGPRTAGCWRCRPMRRRKPEPAVTRRA